MARKYIMTEEEYEAVSKIARKSGMDCWFFIKQNFIRGDYVYDLEERKTMSLRKGLEMLFEGIEGSVLGLTEQEKQTIENLAKKFNLEVRYEIPDTN